MSKRITTKTNITEKAHAITALKNAGWEFTESGDNTIFVRSGPLKNATLNLQTGSIEGDSDYVRKEQLGALRQGYAEVKFRAEAAREGISVGQKSIDKGGAIRLKCRMIANA